MLEHQKYILANICQEKHLFKKELIKSIGWLNPEEVKELHQWAIKNYMHTHKEIISEAFLSSSQITRPASS